MYPGHKKKCQFTASNVSAATLISVFSLWSFRYGRFVSLFFYANATVLIIKMIYDRFLQVVTEHVTIIWPVLF